MYDTRYCTRPPPTGLHKHILAREQLASYGLEAQAHMPSYDASTNMDTGDAGISATENPVAATEGAQVEAEAEETTEAAAGTETGAGADAGADAGVGEGSGAGAGEGKGGGEVEGGDEEDDSEDEVVSPALVRPSLMIEEDEPETSFEAIKRKTLNVMGSRPSTLARGSSAHADEWDASDTEIEAAFFILDSRGTKCLNPMQFSNLLRAAGVSMHNAYLEMTWYAQFDVDGQVGVGIAEFKQGLHKLKSEVNNKSIQPKMVQQLMVYIKEIGCRSEDTLVL